MIIKEICITPQVFDCHNIDASNWKDIKSLLESISESGYIIGLNNKSWIKHVLQNINKNDPKIKDRLVSIISLLKSRDRIAGHPQRYPIVDGNEVDWFQIAMQLNSIRKFYEIVATKTFDGKAISIEQLEELNISERFGLTGSKQYLKTEKNLQDILLPFLSYSKKVVIIDPYFYLQRPGCRTTLNLVAESLRERRGNREKGKISIHCKWDDTKSSAYLKSEIARWQKELIQVSLKYKHDIELRAWEARNIKLHDRYLITNQCGLVSAAGTDKDSIQQSEWSIKDYRELSAILSQYTENADVFQLKCMVSTSAIEYH